MGRERRRRLLGPVFFSGMVRIRTKALNKRCVIDVHVELLLDIVEARDRKSFNRLRFRRAERAPNCAAILIDLESITRN